jgi:hypothetical protein
VTPFGAACTDQNGVSSAANVLWLPLGELLVERGLLSNVQLNIALAQQKQSGRRLGEVLIELGYVSEPALARTLLEQVGLTEHQPEPVLEVPAPVEPVRTLPAPPPLLRPPVPVAEPVAEVAAAPEPAPVEHVAPVKPLAPAPPPAPAAVPSVQPEPRILRLDADGEDREKWWMRSRHDARIAELERVLAEFEQRSKEIESDITRVRGVIAELRQTRI